MKQSGRRSFLKMAGTSLGIGVLYSAYPAVFAKGEAGDMFSSLAAPAGRRSPLFPSSNPATRTSALRTRRTRYARLRAVAMINGLPQRPDLVLFTGDLTHDTEN
ncbi:MAG TPA: hypothetical protein VIX37_08915 [Candidatus Sulfotelmatobacter sp.]